jgi:glycosyltransferase involved in cell wall biosynthesis
MKLIILTQYFPPEVGAPQNRLYEMAVRLQKMGMEIEVLTAMPNYPSMEIHKEYKGKWYVKEEMDGMPIHRAWIWVGKSKNIFPRLLNYFSFVFSSLWIGCFKLSKADYLLCESPPLFTGISAVLLKKFKKAKLILNVSDLWPESAEKLGLIENRTLLNITTKLEEYLYKSSALIAGQTQGIVKSIKGRFPDKNVYWLPNGVDLAFYNPEKITTKWREENGFSPEDFIILYAGIIGYAQALETVIKAAELTKDQSSIKWVLLGSGPVKEKLLAMKEELQLLNVYFYPPVPKSTMPEILKAVDVSLVPLKNIELFRGALPSKMFEALAMKKPLLLGVEGEAKDLFIEQGKAGLAFIPEDAADLVKNALHLYNNKAEAEKLGENGRNYVEANFNRDNIAEKFYTLLNSEK